MHDYSKPEKQTGPAICRDHPFLQPSDQVHWFRRMLENQEVRAVLHLN
jgi:hypothetical protein